MRLSIFTGLVAATLASAASWGFEDASLQVLENRGSEVSSKKPISPGKTLTESISIRSSGLLRLALTVTNGGKPRKPHQAFVTISSDAGLEESFPLNVNDAGKAKLDIKYADIPTALTLSKSPLQASIVIGSFGPSKAIKSNAFTFTVTAATTPSAPAAEAAPRYSALPEIHHNFRDDPRSPPKILSLIFTVAVLAAFPLLLITWTGLGANLSHLGKAFGAAPISHGLFFGSVVAIEFAFWQYYTVWRLYTLLPAVGVMGLVAVVSGSRALTEVQERRLNGER